MALPVMQMPSSSHCRRRAEKLRIALLCTPDPVAATRLRIFVEKYRVLADRADKKNNFPSLDTIEQEHALSEKTDVSDG